MEVVDHVYVFPIETEYFGNQRIWHPAGVETRRGLTLFDVGAPGDAEGLARALAADGFSLEDVVRVVLTHQDLDHIGALAAVVDRTGAEVVAHREDAPAIAGERPRIKRTDSPCDPVAVDLELVGGERLRTEAGPFQAVFTPGHSPGHLVFYGLDARVLLAGDLFRTDAGFTGPTPEFTPDMAEAQRSIAKLLGLDVRRVVCYHGGVAEADTDAIRAVYDGLAEDR